MKRLSPLELVAGWCGRFVAPKTCVVCGATQEASLCDRCLREYLERVPKTGGAGRHGACGRCGRPLISRTSLCTPCLTTDALDSVDKVHPLFSYTGEAPFLLARWKTRGDRSLTWAFARCLSAFLGPRLESFPGYAVVPVPPRPGKVRQRGWDQIEDLSRTLERSYGIPVSRCLVRDSFREQKLLGREGRAHNLKGAVRATSRPAPPARAIVLDDLMTTGATLNACATALKEAGCGEVLGLTLFYD